MLSTASWHQRSPERAASQRVAGRPIKENLAALKELVESGKVIPVIDRTFPLRKAPEAIRYLEVEHARAKVIIIV